MKNLTAVGKFLILMALLGSVTACSSHSHRQSASVNNHVLGPWGHDASLAYSSYRLINESRYRLNDTQKQKQTGAVYSALEGEYGVVYKWFDSNAMGAVKAVHGYPQGSGFCKVIYSTIVVKGKQATFEETACQEEAHEGWRFVQL